MINKLNKEKKMKKLIEEHITETLESGGGDYYIDEEYSIHSQMTDEIMGCFDDEDIDGNERQIINEMLDEYEDDMDKIEEMVR